MKKRDFSKEKPEFAPLDCRGGVARPIDFADVSESDMGQDISDRLAKLNFIYLAELRALQLRMIEEWKNPSATLNITEREAKSIWEGQIGIMWYS